MDIDTPIGNEIATLHLTLVLVCPKCTVHDQSLWYVFVVLCTMQGVFILFAYTCNPKVARSIRNRFLFCSTKTRHATYRTALVGGVKSEHLRRLGLEARDSHDSQSSNTSQASQSSQASLTKTTGTSTTSP